ncbi:MAG: xanthine dehydrogenase accessory protein XdhC [Pseudomonadota bacterium]
MSFQRDEICAFGAPVARVVVAETRGSVPREVGASMLVLEDRILGTIGGGALEFEAIKRARAVLSSGSDRLDRMPLGPALGQCCGGSVTLLTERWDVDRLASVTNFVARRLPGRDGDMPQALRRVLSGARAGRQEAAPLMIGDWFVESVQKAEREIWIWGAGHVGRAILTVLLPFPDLRLRWADTDSSRFPDAVPPTVETLIARNPADLVTLSGPMSEHFVLTFSHAHDLEICHRILGRPFGFLGLIGSATKRARFRKRLSELGHPATQIDRLTCPIGDPSLGKHPQAIAIGVVAKLIREDVTAASTLEHHA